jgi:hypothetical protein
LIVTVTEAAAFATSGPLAWLRRPAAAVGAPSAGAGVGAGG